MIYCFLADGFEEVEALAPVDILRRAGAEVKTVGVTGEYVTGSHGITVKADIEAQAAVLGSSLEAVILPGGMPGTLNLEKSRAVQSAIDFAVANDKLVCAICAAPSILGHKKLLAGREAIAFSFDKAVTVCVNGSLAADFGIVGFIAVYKRKRRLSRYGVSDKGGFRVVDRTARTDIAVNVRRCF